MTDDNPSDDDTCFTIRILDTINVFPYCTSFESNAEWFALNAFTYEDAPRHSWEWGVPDQAPIDQAFHGTNAWMTDLDANYEDRDSSALFTPVFNVDTNTTYKIQFKHSYLTEPHNDGGTVEVSQDGGTNWKVVGNHFFSDWYNTKHVAALELLKPGWSDNSQGWIHAELNLDFQFSGATLFRFRFSSDASVDNIGWAVDSFCFQETTDLPHVTIGLEESYMNTFVLGEVVPNPASAQAYIPYNLVEAGEVNVSIRNLIGQEVYRTSEKVLKGEHAVEVDVSQWEAGMYMVLFEYGNTVLTRKMVVTK